MAEHDPASEMKVCTKCGQEKPLEDFSRHRYAADGRRSRCKTCLRKRPPLAPGHKWCAACNQQKPLDDFRPHAGKRDGRRSRCVACEKQAREEAALEKTKIRQSGAAQTLVSGVKVCKVCGEGKPLASFWCRSDTADGYENTCKRCVQKKAATPDPEDEERASIWDQRQVHFRDLVKSEQVRKRMDEEREGFKVCVSCKQNRLIGWFTRNRNSEDGHGDTCAPCRRKERTVMRRKAADTVAKQCQQDGTVRVSLIDYFGGDRKAMAEHLEEHGFAQDDQLGQDVFVKA